MRFERTRVFGLCRRIFSALGDRLHEAGLMRGYDDKSFVAKGNGSFPLVFDHETLKPEKLDAYAEFFAPVKAKAGDCLVAFGWIMAEELLKYDG